MQIALLSNPHSGRKKHLQKICELAQADPNISHFQASNTQQFIQFVEQLQQNPFDIVAINAGDGTIQALLTLMFARLSAMPLLAILKGGTTNMTGGDVGIHGNCVAGLKQLIQWNNDPNQITRSKVRPVLKIDWDATASPVCGMFFGAGAIIEGQDYFHSHIHKKGLKDSLGPALSALRILFTLNRKEQPLFSPVSMQLSGYDQADYNQDSNPSSAQPMLQSSGKHLLAFASGLERLFLGIHPFWGERRGAWFFSAVRHQPEGYSLLKLLPLFRGKPGIDMTPQQGYLSAKLNHLEIQFNGEFTVDGERYSTSSENHLITISLAGYATFLQL